jgi:predicted porin
MAAVMVFSAANAQVERGTVILSSTFWGSGSGLFINIVPETDSQVASAQVNFGMRGAYYIVRNLALTAGLYLNSDKRGNSDPTTTTAFSAGVKYHFVRGFYGDLAYYSRKVGKNDGVSFGRFELGYDIYLNQYFYIEPAGYCLIGLNDSSSKFGASLGFGVAF